MDNNLEFDIFTGPLTNEDIQSFAQLIGMHPIRDKELLWFAEEKFLDCGVPGWLLVTDSNGNFCWVNEDLQQINDEPPNLTELKDEFQKLRREYIKKKNQASQPQKQSQPQVGQSLHKRADIFSPPQTGPISSKKSANSPVTFELTNTEPRHTYEQSQAKLDPRQALFESKENTNKNLIEDFAELESGEEELEEEENQVESSSDLLQDEKKPLYDSNYHMYQQLRRELDQIKVMYTDLEAENQSLKGTHQKLNLEKATLLKAQNSFGTLEHRLTDSPRFKAVKEGISIKELSIPVNTELEAELHQIKLLLQKNLQLQDENLEREKKAAQELKANIQYMTNNTNPIIEVPGFVGMPNPYLIPSSEDLKSSSGKQSSDFNTEKGLTKGHKRPPLRQGSHKEKTSKASHSKEVNTDKPSYLGFHKKPKHKSKLSVSSQSGQPHSHELTSKLSSLGFIIYRKWKEILGLEWHVLQHSSSRLEKERLILKYRKSGVQKFEWDMMWSIKDSTNEEASTKVIEEIKHVIFEYELDAEKISLLTTLLESRMKLLNRLEKSLEIAFKSGRIDQAVDDHLTLLFTQYIEIANLYEYKLRINTSSLNPCRKNKLQSRLFSSMRKNLATHQSIFLPLGNKGAIGETKNKTSSNHNLFDPSMSHLEFLKFTMSKVREGNPVEGSVFSEISSYFETQFSWFDSISDEIRVIMRNLDNPTNISALRKG